MQVRISIEPEQALTILQSEWWDPDDDDHREFARALCHAVAFDEPLSWAVETGNGNILPISKPIPQAGDIYRCPVCHDTFDTRGVAEDHFEAHTDTEYIDQWTVSTHPATTSGLSDE